MPTESAIPSVTPSASTSKAIREDWRELFPAYGRDFPSGKAAKANFASGKDWLLIPQEVYCSIRDFAPGVQVLLRYNSQRRVAVYKVRGTEQYGS